MEYDSLSIRTFKDNYDNYLLNQLIGDRRIYTLASFSHRQFIIYSHWNERNKYYLIIYNKYKYWCFINEIILHQLHNLYTSLTLVSTCLLLDYLNTLKVSNTSYKDIDPSTIQTSFCIKVCIVTLYIISKEVNRILFKNVTTLLQFYFSDQDYILVLFSRKPNRAANQGPKWIYQKSRW